MRRILLIALGVILALPVVLVAAVIGLLETKMGQSTLRDVAERASGIRIASIEGSPLHATTISGIEMQDAEGTWLRVGRVELAWSPWRLLSRHVEITHLHFADVDLQRLPASDSEAAPAAEDGGGAGLSELPVAITVRDLSLDGAHIAAAIAGTEVVLGAKGQAALGRDLHGTAELVAEAEGGGRYALTLNRTGVVALKAEIREPENGIIARVAGLPALGALSLDATAEGDPQRAETRAELGFAGGVHATAQGTLALEGDGNDLAVTAQVTQGALAAVLPPDIALRQIAAQLRLRGALALPQVEGTVTAEDLAAAGAAVAETRLNLTTRPEGTAMRVNADVAATGVQAPPDLPVPPLGDGPLTLSVTALRAEDGTITLDRAALAHALLNAEARGRITAASTALDVSANVPDLRPFAAASGVEAGGALALTGHVTQEGTKLGGDASLRLTDAVLPAPMGDVLGATPTVEARAEMDEGTIRLERLTVSGQAITAEASGTAGDQLDLTAEVDLPVLTALAQGVSGQAHLSLRATGTMADPNAHVVLAAPVLAVDGVGEGKLDLTADGQHLLSAPTLNVQGNGAIGDRPIVVDVQAAPRPDGSIDVPKLLARYGTAEVTGSGSVTADQRPDLSLSAKAPDLAALAPGLAGRIEAALRLTPDQTGGVAAKLDATGRDIAASGNRVGALSVAATVADALRAPQIAAEAKANGLNAGGITGDLTARAEGTPESLALRVGLTGPLLTANLTGGFATPGTVRLETFEARMKGEPVRLLAPTTITLGPPIDIAPVAIGLRGGRIDVSGKVGDSLALKLGIRRLPLALASIAAPDLALAGTLDADADITGTPAAPSGTARVAVRGAKMTSGPAATLPAASLDANLRLEAAKASVQANLNAGSALRLRATAEGRTDMTGPVRATVDGPVDLTLLDPILSPAGRRARGTLTLALRADGPLPLPALSGTVRLSGASVEDSVMGVRLTGMNGTIRAHDDVLEIADLTARAGNGTLSVQGTLRPTTPNLPLDMAITARNATLSMGEMVTTRLGADLKIAGEAMADMSVTGRVAISHADVRLPDRLPASVVDLPVREVNGSRPQTAPAPAAAPAAAAAMRIGLDIAVDAPRAVFIRGMGVDAEMGGQLRIAGTADAPDIQGELTLRRGTIAALSQSFTFREGKIDFNGSQGIDPALNMVAATQAADVTALINLGGTASAPKITLGSEPDMPQDEVLARILFGRSQSTLTPFQILSLAQAAAELAGVTSPGGGALDRVRSGLGLDRLNVGSDENTGETNVEAGRYLADGVYLGARQGTDGTPQATVQIEVLPNVKIEADVGGEGTGRAGVSWGFDY